MCMPLTQQICPPLCTLLYHLYLKTYRESETPSSGTSSPLTVVDVPLRTCKYGSSVTPQIASADSFIWTIVRAMNSSRGPYRHLQGPAESMPVTLLHPLRLNVRATLLHFTHPHAKGCCFAFHMFSHSALGEILALPRPQLDFAASTVRPELLLIADTRNKGKSKDLLLHLCSVGAGDLLHQLWC